MRAGILKEADVPAEYREVLGDTIRERLNALIHDIVIHSQGKDDIVMSPEMEKAMRGMRNFLFENVYHNPLAKREEKRSGIFYRNFISTISSILWNCQRNI